jgi:beta-galactosidase
MRLILNGLTCWMLLACLLVSKGRAAPREAMSLDGVWNFATDPGDRGEAEKWYEPAAKLPQMPLAGYAANANGTIRVPGIWDNQGYGVETDKMRHNFVGKGWYKRQVEIPRAWEGQRVFLRISGVSRYAKAWIDDHFLGEHIGYLSAQEYEVTQYSTPGKSATITIQVDSKQRWEVDAMCGASSLIDFVDVPWGGIWGHVSLEARSNAWLSDLFVQPDTAISGCSAGATLNGNRELADTAKLELFDQGGRRVSDVTAAVGPHAPSEQPITIKARLPNAQLWTPDTPVLYRARFSLMKGDQLIDLVESRFGMRQFTIDGPYLLLNGKRLMLRGYGDDHIYPEQMSMPSDKELHLRRLRTIKSYGFNHVRHHSTIMPPEYYDACDELGMISTAEFPIAYNVFLPGVGSKWLASVPPGTDAAPALETYRREWAAAVKQHRNHPSILCWVMGNELGQYDDLPKPRSLFGGIARQFDPQRFFLDSDGVAASVLQDPQKDRDLLDFFSIQFDDPGANPIDKPEKFHSPKPRKPSISHEAGNYVTFSRPDLLDQFQHNFKPFWLTAGRAKLDELGLREEADRWAEKSERLYALLHKYNIEGIRKNPYLSGYHWWLFQDYWTTSNGIVDHYFRPKSIGKEEVLKFNGDVVLLQEGLQRTYRGNNRLKLKLLVSNFSGEALGGSVRWEVKAGDRSLTNKQQTLAEPTGQGELAEIGIIDLDLPDIGSPEKLKIDVEMSANGRRFANDWSSWLYPAVIRPAKLPVPVFAESTYSRMFPDWGFQPIPSKSELDDRAVYLASWPCDPRIAAAMQRGAGVVLLDGADQLLKSYPITFRTSWWRAEKSWEDRNHTGTLVYEHPATRAMAPDGWCDDGWFYLVEGAKKYDLQTAPARPNVIVRALPSMLTVEDQALLFEVGIGKGNLVVSGLNHRQAPDQSENQWLVARLLVHAAGFPQPKANWPASFLSIVSIAPQDCVPGFHRLVSNAGEDQTWYSYREDHARVFVSRQTKPGNLVAWETAPVPNEPERERITFVFAGALGYGSEPQTDGFVLEINGKETLRFDLPEPTTWRSADNRVELRFESRRTISPDRFGLFHLVVPRDLVKPGEPCVLGVRSLGKDSRRWFGLNPYY